MAKDAALISPAGSTLGETRHVCALHPMVIIGGILQRNAFYLPPQQLLPEIRERRAKQVSRAAGI
jgi:hypothetical protein